VGCVYTAQGFEYDWSGVILGPDLVWRDGRWVSQPGKSHDSAVKRALPDEFDQAIRNTYKVLLTRGMVGTLIFSADAETQEMLSGLLSPVRVANTTGTEWTVAVAVGSQGPDGRPGL
jgi:uncharacterized protein